MTIMGIVAERHGIDLAGVDAGYGGAPVLHHVDFTVREDQFTGIVGTLGAKFTYDIAQTSSTSPDRSSLASRSTMRRPISDA